MIDWTSRTGGCRCGRLRFRITAPPIMTMACHCKGCQRMTASAFSLSLTVANDGFSIEQGQPVRGGAQEIEGLEHSFCDDCKSWVFTRFPEVMGDFVNVRSAMLDETAGIEPFIETCTAEALPWAKIPATHSFEGFPPADAFVSLMREYAAR
ncbi:GFA family protein [Halomonas binhaiensis]|uniref:GFA family protein n=1 Tax=Halomonas binhaiensis TaxID=2562282 RepID=A0A5C1NBE1_9GAMM|nr:GFA family protein [Halomonas binhaiensis]QEM80260.1 GFA family protein [Halomonas binhaiensis]